MDLFRNKDKLVKMCGTYLLLLFFLIKLVYRNNNNGSSDIIIFFVLMIIIFTAINFCNEDILQQKNYRDLGFLIFSWITFFYIIIRNLLIGDMSLISLISKLYFYIIFIGFIIFRPNFIYKKLDKYGNYGDFLVFLPLMIFIIIDYLIQ